MQVIEKLGYLMTHEEEVEQLQEHVLMLRSALSDALSGWQYIRTRYGDLDGVGWTRVERGCREALAATEPKDYDGPNVPGWEGGFAENH